jgi:hypothetical protein
MDATLAFQFSSWYPKFSHISLKSTIIRPLPSDFREYLESDGVFVPGEDDDLEDSEAEADVDVDTPPRKRFSFPGLDVRIQECIDEYEAVFPKLNFSSPKVVLMPTSPQFFTTVIL